MRQTDLIAAADMCGQPSISDKHFSQPRVWPDGSELSSIGRNGSPKRLPAPGMPAGFLFTVDSDAFKMQILGRVLL